MVPVARLGKQLIVKTPNEIGTLAAISNAMASEGINMLCLGAIEQGNEGHFWIVTDNNSAGAERLKSKGYTVEERDVVLVEIGNKAGTLAPVAKVISDCPINVHNCFFTTAKERVTGFEPATFSLAKVSHHFHKQLKSLK